MPDYASIASRPKRVVKLVESKSKLPLLWPTVFVVLIIAADQVSKLWAVAVLTGQPPMEIVGRWFMFSLVYNQGGALGTQIGSPLYYLVVSLIIVPFIVYYIYHYRHSCRLSWSLALILGGALGNIIDRIRMGKVIDFIDVDIPDIAFLNLTRWWTFNVADAAIFCATIYMVIYLLWFYKKEEDQSIGSHSSGVVGNQ